MKIPAALPAIALLAALTLCATAQKMRTPAGEAPGPWLLGTIGVLLLKMGRIHIGEDDNPTVLDLLSRSRD